MTWRYQTFTVRWHHTFPLDMLRYDGCHPVDGQAVAAISHSLSNNVEVSRGPHEARLGRMVEGKKDQPTTARWSSFGMAVEDIYTR